MLEGVEKMPGFEMLMLAQLLAPITQNHKGA